MAQPVRSARLVALFLLMPVAAAAQGPPRALGAARSIGITRVLAVPVLFDDSPPAPVTRLDLQQRLFDGPSDISTLTGFYLENSQGLFTLTGVVSDWVRVPMTLGQTGSNLTLPSLVQLLTQVVVMVDATTDFREYDNDGPDGVPNSGDDDGIVDGGLILYAGHAPSFCSPDGWGLSGLTIRGQQIETSDIGARGLPLRIVGGSFQSALRCNGSLASLGTSAHELGHLLFAFPDIYSAGTPTGSGFGDGRRWRTGCWDLMSAGSGWGCGDPGYAERPTPTNMIPWEKQLLGWSTPIVVGEVRQAEFTLQPGATGGRALRIPISPGQYFEIEYRERLGFDRDLPESGVLIFHVDSSRGPPSFCPACIADAPPLLIEADANLGLQRTFSAGGDKGTASDAFGLTKTTFSGVTTPRALTENGLPTTLTVHDVSVDTTAHEAKVVITTAATPAAVDPPTMSATFAPLAPVAIESEVVGGALPYSWTATNLPPGVMSTSTGSTLRLTGTLQAAGTLTPAVDLTDALGTTVTFAFQWHVPDLVTDGDRIVQALLSAVTSTLSQQESGFLDKSGNGNGRLDVGDLRAFLMRNP